MRVPRDSDFTSRLRSPAVAARVGTWLGVSFGICFLTGLVSHWAQLPDPAVPLPTAPVWGYRLTQGLHVASGTAAVPLLLVKLWTVFPRLFTRPPVGPLADAWRGLALHAAERGSIAVLVAAAVFELATGLANVTGWYPWPFSFRAAHYAVAWWAAGALLVHVAVKLPAVRQALAADLDSDRQDRPGTAPGTAGLTRRGLLRSTWAAAVVAALATAGGTVPWWNRAAVLGARSGAGPAGVPVNKSARAADVTAAATSPAYRLRLRYADREVALTRAELAALPQTTVELPIACVEGWSATGTWTGVRLRELLELVGAPPGRTVRVRSLQPDGPYRETTLPDQFADHPDTLLALALAGAPLSLDHGYPCRLIAPNRPGVLQTKWVASLEVPT